MEFLVVEEEREQPAEPLELCCLPFELQLLCASHVRDGRDLAALRAAASWATALVDGAVSPLTLFAWHLRARRARASARTVHAPRGKPRFIVLRTPHALRLIGGMQTPGLCCGHRQRPMHEHTIAGSWAACSFGIRHTVCVRADGVAVGYGQGWSFLEGGARQELCVRCDADERGGAEGGEGGEGGEGEEGEEGEEGGDAAEAAVAAAASGVGPSEHSVEACAVALPERVVACEACPRHSNPNPNSNPSPNHYPSPN